MPKRKITSKGVWYAGFNAGIAYAKKPRRKTAKKSPRKRRK